MIAIEHWGENVCKQLVISHPLDKQLPSIFVCKKIRSTNVGISQRLWLEHIGVTIRTTEHSQNPYIVIKSTSIEAYERAVEPISREKAFRLYGEQELPASSQVFQWRSQQRCKLWPCLIWTKILSAEKSSSIGYTMDNKVSSTAHTWRAILAG